MSINLGSDPIKKPNEPDYSGISFQQDAIAEKQPIAKSEGRSYQKLTDGLQKLKNKIVALFSSDNASALKEKIGSELKPIAGDRYLANLIEMSAKLKSIKLGQSPLSSALLLQEKSVLDKTTALINVLMEATQGKKQKISFKTIRNEITALDKEVDQIGNEIAKATKNEKIATYKAEIERDPSKAAKEAAKELIKTAYAARTDVEKNPEGHSYFEISLGQYLGKKSQENMKLRNYEKQLDILEGSQLQNAITDITNLIKKGYDQLDGIGRFPEQEKLYNELLKLNKNWTTPKTKDLSLKTPKQNKPLAPFPSRTSTASTATQSPQHAAPKPETASNVAKTSTQPSQIRGQDIPKPNEPQSSKPKPKPHSPTGSRTGTPQPIQQKPNKET